MRRGCYVDVTLIILWCYVEETLMLLLGWGGVGWGGGGCNNVHVSCVQGDATWMLRWRYVHHTLMLRWGDVDATVGVGWGGVGGGVITFMSLACKVMRRGCYVDVTFIILWCYVEETLMLLLGWGGVGWGGCNNVHVSCVQGDATWMLRWRYVDHAVMLRWSCAVDTRMLLWSCPVATLMLCWLYVDVTF